MNVYLYRAEGVDESMVERILELLNRHPGPAKFQLAHPVAPHLNYENYREFAGIRTAYQTKSWVDMREYWMSQYESRSDRGKILYDADYNLRRSFHNNRNQDTEILWNVIFNVCEDLRNKWPVAKEDFVCLLTNQTNERNWFSAADPQNPRNTFVQTSDWEHYIPADPVYPITYEIVALLLQTSMYDGFSDLMANVHYNPIGCMMDFCQDKSDISLKMRTGDICPACQKRIAKRKINPLLVQQVFRIFNSVREEMLFKQMFTTLEIPSRLEIKGHECCILFRDMGGLELQLTPRQKAVFMVYLDHPEGISYNELDDLRPEIAAYYSIFAPNLTATMLNNSIQELVCFDGAISQEVSRINKKLKEMLGEDLAKQYQIQGTSGEKKFIRLNRDLVRREG